MPSVIDYSWYRPEPAALKAAGIVAVCRYLSWRPNGKVIDRAEYDALQAAGIAVVLNWESSGTSYEGGYPAGLREGTEARKQARELGHPDTRPIIQSVDTGVEPDQALREYQRGFNDGGGCGPQGFYGDVACGHDLLAQGLVSIFWQANARGWPGSGVDSPEAALIQRTSHSFPTIPANQYDESDVCKPDYGQSPAPLVAPVPHALPPKVIDALKALAAFVAAVTARPVRLGDSGPRVGKIQALIKAHSPHGTPLGRPGHYDPELANAVHRFKRAHGLKNLDGNRVGRACLLALLKAK